MATTGRQGRGRLSREPPEKHLAFLFDLGAKNHLIFITCFCWQIHGHSHGMLRKRRRRSWLDKKTPGCWFRHLGARQWLCQCYPAIPFCNILWLKSKHVMLWKAPGGSRNTTRFSNSKVEQVAELAILHQFGLTLKLSILGASIIWVLISISYRYHFISFEFLWYHLISISSLTHDPHGSYICPFSNNKGPNTQFEWVDLTDPTTRVATRIPGASPIWQGSWINKLPILGWSKNANLW